MKFEDLKKDMILKFNYGSTEKSYIYIDKIESDKIFVTEIKIFDRRKNFIHRENLVVSEFMWNHKDMVYSRHDEIKDVKEIIENILKYDYIHLKF